MAALLYRLLNCRERRPFSLRGRALTLALLPAQELLAARLAGETAEDPLEGALHGSAELVSRCLRTRRGRRVFSGAGEVLKALSAEEINAVAAAYRRWSAEIDPGLSRDAETLDALKKA